MYFVHTLGGARIILTPIGDSRSPFRSGNTRISPLSRYSLLQTQVVSGYPHIWSPRTVLCLPLPILSPSFQSSTQLSRLPHTWRRLNKTWRHYGQRLQLLMQCHSFVDPRTEPCQLALRVLIYPDSYFHVCTPPISGCSCFSCSHAYFAFDVRNDIFMLAFIRL